MHDPSLQAVRRAAAFESTVLENGLTVRGLLLDEIARLKREGVDEELFTLCKNQLYGELVQDLENIEDVAGALASSFFRGRTPADEIETLASVTLSDVNGALRAMLCTERSATVIIRPAQ